MARLLTDQGEQDEAQFRTVEQAAAATAPPAPAHAVAEAFLEGVGEAAPEAAMATARQAQRLLKMSG